MNNVYLEKENDIMEYLKDFAKNYLNFLKSNLSEKK